MVCKHHAQRQIELGKKAHNWTDCVWVLVALLSHGVGDFLHTDIERWTKFAQILRPLDEVKARIYDKASIRATLHYFEQV